MQLALRPASVRLTIGAPYPRLKERTTKPRPALPRITAEQVVATCAGLAKVTSAPLAMIAARRLVLTAALVAIDRGRPGAIVRYAASFAPAQLTAVRAVLAASLVCACTKAMIAT